MNLPKLKALVAGRFGRTVIAIGLSGVMLAGSAGAAQASVGTEPGAVQLNPQTGAKSSTPTWSTSLGCNPGFQGSAVFREVHADGVTTNSISPAVNNNNLTGFSVAEPFSGTLQATMAQIQTAGGIPDGGIQELVVICFSGPGLTGTSDPEMDTDVLYNADGTYVENPVTCGVPCMPMPVGAIGGIALAGLTAIGLGWMQFRRLRSRRQKPVAAA